MNLRTQNLLIAFVLGSLVVGFAAVEDWYEEYFYGADGIAYFDVANCISHGDWAWALNPYWSIGYPLVLAAAQGVFPHDWAGEWTAIRVVSLVAYVLTFLSFLQFIKVAASYTATATGFEERSSNLNILYLAGSVIFLAWNIQGRIPSRTTPDLMVCGLFFLLMSASLQFCMRPSAKWALLMGLFAGLGYVTKAFFLPLAMIVFLVVVVSILIKSGRNFLPPILKLVWAAPTLALLTIPYVAGMSMVLGRFTLGESGSLNYAWTVNKLDHWHWTGGPAQFGEPIHPVRLVCESPHVYEFGEPFHVTYPVFFNPFYWYEGYRHFFNLGNEIAAIKLNLFNLTNLFFDTPHAPVKLVVAIALLVAASFFVTSPKVYWQRLLSIWPIYIPPLLGIAVYTLVVLEVRYIFGFIVILLIAPLLALFVPTPLVGKRIAALIVVLISLIAFTHVLEHMTPMLKRAARHEAFTSDEDWRVGLYLAANGPAPGSKVAMVRVERGMQTTWAYVSDLHVIGQIGNQDFNEDQQEKDFHLFIDHPDVQQTVFDLFRKAGAVIVVATDVPGAPQGDGWTQVPGAKAWVHSL